MREILQSIARLMEASAPFAVVTVIEVEGSTPREVGAKMVVCLDGSAYGSIGGGCGEKQVLSAAIRCLVRDKQPEIVDVDLTDDLGIKDGDVCGGKMLVFVEPFLATP